MAATDDREKQLCLTLYKEKSTPEHPLPGDSTQQRTTRKMVSRTKLFDMMRAKGAKPGNPICRSALREAARKYIGDTGLLDHLLKHMVDKETGDGQRFRRRHNSEGNLEYWLEDADLMQIRKSAGIEDPFWLPPPGWSPGDKLPAGGYSCRGMTDSEAAQIESLKQEVEKLKRQLSRLGSSPAETETLTQNSYPTRRDSETKGEIKSQVETLRASIEELQNAYIHLHELHKENAVFMQQKEAGSAKTGNKAEKELRERDNDRLNKLELQVRNIAKEAAVEKLAAESQFKVLWKVVMALQMFQDNKVTVRPMEECTHNRMEQAEIRTLDEEIGWLGLAPPA